MSRIDKQTWIDSMMGSMSPEERIAQLLHVPAWSNRDEAHEAALLKLVSTYNIGGIIFFQGTARKQAEMTNRLQAAAKVPLFISIDGEWGLAMRLDETLAFPYAMTLGAIEDDALIYACGKAIGRHCRRLGIHINHAPVVDINTEPDNPVIGFRAFGADPQRVAQKAVAFLKGQQDAGVMAVAKHFPGHGDTSVDSHLALPLVKHDLKRFQEWEWYPFQQTFDAGVGGVMVAHLAVPILEPDEQLPASLSPRVIQDFLQQELDFKGLIFSDALNMKGATGRYEQGEGDLLAVKAGHDVLVYVEDVPVAVSSIQAAVGRGEISRVEIDRRVRKQLAAKFDAGLSERASVDLSNLEQDLHTEEDKQLILQLFEAAATLQIHSTQVLPLQAQEQVSFVLLGADQQQFWQSYFPDASFFLLSNESKEEEVEGLFQKLNQADKVILVLHGLTQKAGLSFSLEPSIQSIANQLLDRFAIVLVLPGNPYVLGKLKASKAEETLIVFDDREAAWHAAAKILLGQKKAHGSLPISL
jgi:beta-glucosidase-like glycosyl hydrolase